MEKINRDPPLKRGLPPSHPGEILREVTLPALKAEGVPRTRVAELLGLPRRTFYDLLEGTKDVDAELALKLGRLLGVSPQMWINLQVAYDLHHARERLGDALDAIPTLTVKAA